MGRQLCQALLMLFFVYLVWGGNYIVVKLALVNSPPFFLAGMRCLISFPVLLVMARLLRQKLAVTQADVLIIIGSALFLSVIASAGVTWAQTRVPANIAAAIVASAGLWFAILSAIFVKGREKAGIQNMASAIIGLFGVALVLLREIQGGSHPVFYYLVLLGASISIASGSILLRWRQPQCGLLATVAYQSGFSSLLLLIISYCSGEKISAAVGASYMAIAYLAVVGSGLSYGAYYWLVANVSSGMVASVSYVTPVVAIFLASWILGESLSPVQYSGVAIIIVAVAASVYLYGKRDAQLR